MKQTAQAVPDGSPSLDAAGILRALFEQTAVGIAQIDTTTGRFLRVNQRCAEMMGCSPEEMVRLDFQTPTHSENLAADLDNVRRLMAGEIREFTTEKQYRHKDGHVVWVQLTILPLCTPGEPPRFHIAVMEDITTRKQMAAEKRPHNQQLQDVEQLQGLAAIAAVAIENARLYESAQRELAERELAEAALREKTAEMDRFFVTTLDLLCVADTDGCFRRLNPQWEAVLGYPLAELQGKRFLDLVHPEDLDLSVQALARLYTQEPVLNFVNRYRCKDGSYRWFEWRSSPQGKLIYAAARDITEHKQSEAALREGEGRLRAIIEQAPFGAHSYELQAGDRLVLTGANRSADQMLGIDHTPLIGRSIEEAFPALAGTPIPDTYRRLAVNAGGFEDEQVVYEEGRIHGAFAIHAFHTGANRMTVFFRDITERKRAELSLQASERRFAQLLQNAFDVVVILDANGIQRYVSASAERMHGYAPAELVNIPVIEAMIHPDDQAMVQAAFQRILATGEGGVEYRHRRKAGGWVHLEARGVNLLNNPDIGGVVVNVRDITERKRAEAEREQLQSQLTQAQKMESVGRLAGGVAHDFNNMLQAILGNAALALQDLPPDSPVRESLEEIEKSAHRSADLTRQLLAFARRQTIAPKVLDLNDTVGGMLKMLRRLIGEGIDLSWMPGANLWPVKMDPGQIDQVLANLCVNARDAIVNVGTVTIETVNVTIDDTYVATHPDVLAGDYVLLVVSDTGKGMDTDTLSHVFEPFFTTKEPGKGTGLGLATVFGIVKQNLGLISVYSEPGHGTTFKIYLPRTETPEISAVAAERKSDLRGTETVLLVEDETQILGLAKRILQQLGYTVLAASSPEAALKLAGQHSGEIHSLITDVVMPGMNGRELRNQLAAFQPDLRCLYMSGYTADVIAHHGVLDEGVQFLQKPFTIQSLAEQVREILR